MADNTVLDPGTGGDTIRDKDRAGVKTPIVAFDLNPAGSETLMAGSMPVTDNDRIVDNAGFTDGTSKVSMSGYVLDEVAGTALTENDAAAARVDSKRAQVLVLEDATTRGQRAAVSAGGAVKVDNSAVTQPVSAASLPLPAGAATSAKQPALGTAGAASTDVLSVQGIASMTALKTDGSAVTQPVSAASLPLPSGASTAAKQPALGTAGSASADVLSVQGVASMTALKVDGSGVTQPVSLAGTQAVNHAQVAGTTTDVNTGNASAGTQRVVLASNQPVVPVSDNAGSLTVDAPVGTPVFVTVTPSTSGGWTPKVFSAASAAAKTLINGVACTFGGHLTIYNPNASVAYIQVFDAATTAAVTVGTTPATALIIIPAASAANVITDAGIHMASGIVIAATTTAAGSTGVTTALDGTILYK